MYGNTMQTLKVKGRYLDLALNVMSERVHCNDRFSRARFTRRITQFQNASYVLMRGNVIYFSHFAGCCLAAQLEETLTNKSLLPDNFSKVFQICIPGDQKVYIGCYKQGLIAEELIVPMQEAQQKLSGSSDVIFIYGGSLSKEFASLGYHHLEIMLDFSHYFSRYYLRSLHWSLWINATPPRSSVVFLIALLLLSIFIMIREPIDEAVISPQPIKQATYKANASQLLRLFNHIASEIQLGAAYLRIDSIEFKDRRLHIKGIASAEAKLLSSATPLAAAIEQKTKILSTINLTTEFKSIIDNSEDIKVLVWKQKDHQSIMRTEVTLRIAGMIYWYLQHFSEFFANTSSELISARLSYDKSGRVKNAEIALILLDTT